MISATEALALVKVSDSDREEVQAMVAKLDEHTRTHMTFSGPPQLSVPFHVMGKTASQILCYVMKRFKWNVSITLMSEQPRFQGGQPVPHHWLINMMPASDVYDNLLADFEIEPKIQLM